VSSSFAARCDPPAGQAVHTGCLSAAPQRFVIGSNSFRTRTCFEEPLHPHCSRSAKAASNRCGSPSPKGFAPPKTIRGGRITAGIRRKHHAPSAPVHLSFRVAPFSFRFSSARTPRRYLVSCAPGSAWQSEFPYELRRGSAAHDRKGRCASPLVPIHGVRKKPSPTPPRATHNALSPTGARPWRFITSSGSFRTAKS